MRFPIAFCVGVGATLAWQAYGDTAREMVANAYPDLGWLAPQSAVAQTASAKGMPRITSADPEDLKMMSYSLAAMQQKVDEIAASQDQVNRDISVRLQVAKQEILDKLSPPSAQPSAAAPARKPVSSAPQAAAPAR
jgi:hypothetical protein